MLYLQIESPKSSVLNFLDSNSFEVIISIFQRTEKVPDMERLRGKETAMNNNLNFMFGMFEPTTDSVIVNTGVNSVLVIRCKECNSCVIFEEPNDIVYLYRLAEDSPLTYAKLALKENSLQDYVDGMSELN